MNPRKLLAGCLCAVFLLSLGVVRARAAEGRTVKIVLVGDSTVNDDQGWGPGFKKHLKGDVTCANWAKNGRSSRSFIDEGWWQKALAEKPDYVLIQFGHNDQPGKGPQRETDARTTYKDFLRKYIDQTRAAGGKPVLVTSLSRRRFGAEGKVREDLAAYAQAVREVGKETGAPVVDLNARSTALLNELGAAGAEKFDPAPKEATVEGSTTTGPTTAAAKGSDKTHLSPAGKDAFGAIVAEELKRVVPELAAHLD